jgi:F0F1-type ATP synthase membrane subunit b/b'
MEKSKKYEMEERNKKVKDTISEILQKESNIEEIRQKQNKTMEETKANVLYILSQIQEK